MAIEALLANNRTFVHKPQHDLESILYIILYICTLVRGPCLPLYELDATHPGMPPPISTWFCSGSVRELGLRKLAHLEAYDTAILPYFTPYWCDFTPFVKDLITTCFSLRACVPNTFQYDQALRILKAAYSCVGEPQTGRAQASPSHAPAPKVFGAQRTRKRLGASKPLDRDFKKRIIV
jgi:hypothetical protein